MNDKVVIRKETVVATFEIVFPDLPGETVVNDKKS
jgi:hypothetical protein